MGNKISCVTGYHDWSTPKVTKEFQSETGSSVIIGMLMAGWYDSGKYTEQQGYQTCKVCQFRRKVMRRKYIGSTKTWSNWEVINK